MDIRYRTATAKDKKILEGFQAKLVQYERAIVPSIPKDTTYYDVDALLAHKETLIQIVEADGMMYLDEEYRRKGIGTTLVKKFLDWLHEKKVQDIRLRVYDKNLDAVHAYRNCGFESFMVEMIYKH